MKKERRWMTSLAKEVAKTKVELPWARGPRRQAFIAKRAALSASDNARV